MRCQSVGGVAARWLGSSRWSARSFYGSACEVRSVTMASGPRSYRCAHARCTRRRGTKRGGAGPKMYVAGETNMTRTTVATLLVLGFALLPRAEARDLQQVLNTGTLRVGVTLYPPWAARAANGDLIGFEIDVAKQLAADLKVKADAARVRCRTVDSSARIRRDRSDRGRPFDHARPRTARELQPTVCRRRHRSRHPCRAHRQRQEARGPRRREPHDRGRRWLGGRATRQSVCCRARNSS